MQVHIRILETTQENISALLLGLEYLINISYVDDTEVFKVWRWHMFHELKYSFLKFMLIELLSLLPPKSIPNTNILLSCMSMHFSSSCSESALFIYYFYVLKYQVCLDYWNILVSELFEPHRSLENPAATATNMMGSQVLSLVTC
jgi:hypothetical protein